MNSFQLVLSSEEFSLVLDSLESFLNLEAELSENLANASSNVISVSLGSEGSGIGLECSGICSKGSDID